ncbi:MAG: hypothetical protein ACRD4Q_04095 [Candidatus Acidiferrales bacterium]
MKAAVRIAGLVALTSVLTGRAVMLLAASPAPFLSGVVLLQQVRTGNGEQLFDWINLAILIAVLVYVLRKPAAAFFRQRSDGIREGLEEGRKALEAARAQLEAVEEKMRGLEQEIAALKDEAARETEAERERLKIAAEKDTERILSSAQSAIESAVRAAKAELTAHAMRQAADVAERMIGERLDEAGRASLMRRFLDGIRHDGSAPRA